MGAPQIIMICVLVAGFVTHGIKHGEPRMENYNIFVEILSIGIKVGLLWWGGFFG